MSTDFFDPKQPAFWRGLLISSVLLSVALILIGYFTGLVFLSALMLLLIFPVAACLALLGALFWLKVEHAFENLKSRFTHSLGVAIGFKSSTHTLPVQTNTASEAIPAEQRSLLDTQQETRNTYSSPLSSVNSIEESTWFDTSHFHSCKKIATHPQQKSGHENQTTIPSIVQFW